MVKNLIPYLFIGAYLLLTLVIGIIGYRSQKDTPEDYFLAERKIGSIVLFFTLIATNFSAFAFLGLSGAGYRIGISYYPMIGFGTALVGITFYFIGYKVWLLGKEKGLITPSELIANRLPSQPLKLTFSAVMVIFTIPYLTLQPIGGGYLLENLTNGQIPYFWGAAFLTFIIVLYVFIGGMKSVALTDVLQGVLMWILMIVAVVTISQSIGGFTEANQTVYQLKPELFSRSGANNFFTPHKWFSYMLLWGLSVPMFPQMFMRFYTPKNPNSLKLSASLYPLITCTMFICPVLIGMWGHINFPDLVGKEADKIFPMMLAEYTSTTIASLVMVGALAAFMSTLDSQLLALSSMMTRDIYIVYIRPQATLREQTFVGKIFIVILSIIGLINSANPPETIAAIATQAFTGLAVLFPTVIAALYGKNISPLSCLISIIFGEMAVLGFQVDIIPKSWALGFLPVVPIVVICSLIIVVFCRE